MHVFTFPTGPFDTNTYILSSERTLDAVIIDPGVGSYATLIKEINKKSLKPTAIWLTHSHWDHIGDAAGIKKEFNIPIYIHNDDKENLENPGSDGLTMPVQKIEGVIPDHLIKDGDILFIDDISFLVIHTPGHSPGGVCFYSEKENVLISGDTLFKDGMGSLSLPTSQPKKMRPSLKKLSGLPPDTVVYSGHGPKTILKDESWLQNLK
jgi:hydroxyacylglutathione hydrolase